MPRQGFVIAVDGPAASGKGTVAGGLARELGLPYLDTGLLYRAVGVLMARAGQDLSDEAAAVAQAHMLTADLLADPGFRTRGAGEAASRVAVYPRVRQALLEFQRTFAHQPEGAVLDGRDIGTVIAPEADVKLFVTALPEVRAQRRVRELMTRGMPAHYEDVLIDIRARDERDSNRDVAPLAQATDAILLDTSDLDVDAAIAMAIQLVGERVEGGR